MIGQETGLDNGFMG